MIVSILLGFVAGFFAGNGLPYFITGSFAKEHQLLLGGKSAYANVVAGVILFAIAALGWHFADVKDHPAAVYISTLLVVLVVGLIHARDWAG